jgi:hypothetical protein
LFLQALDQLHSGVERKATSEHRFLDPTVAKPP